LFDINEYHISNTKSTNSNKRGLMPKILMPLKTMHSDLSLESIVYTVPQKVHFCRIGISMETSAKAIIETMEKYLDHDNFHYNSTDCLLITFANPYTIYLANRDHEFRNSLQKFDFVLVDGISLVHAVRGICRVTVDRISFDSSSLALPVFEAARKNDWNVVLVGGRDGVAEGAALQIIQHYPGLRVVACLDGYQPLPDLVDQTRRFGQSLVICGMGPNNQERFLVALSKSGWKGVGISCGGYFDQLQQSISYYPEWVDRMDLRWLYRLVKEPSRLWRRYLVAYPASAVLILRHAVRARNGANANKS